MHQLFKNGPLTFTLCFPAFSARSLENGLLARLRTKGLILGRKACRLCLCLSVDAAAALLDARCLQTFANTGDCAAWRVCNDANNKHLGKNTRLSSPLDPLFSNKPRTCRDLDGEQKMTRRKPASAPRGRRPSAASATTASSSTAAGPEGSTIFLSCCPRLGLPFFRWRTVLLRIAPECTQDV